MEVRNGESVSFKNVPNKSWEVITYPCLKQLLFTAKLCGFAAAYLQVDPMAPPFKRTLPLPC